MTKRPGRVSKGREPVVVCVFFLLFFASLAYYYFLLCLRTLLSCVSYSLIKIQWTRAFGRTRELFTYMSKSRTNYDFVYFFDWSHMPSNLARESVVPTRRLGVDWFSFIRTASLHVCSHILGARGCKLHSESSHMSVDTIGDWCLSLSQHIGESWVEFIGRFHFQHQSYGNLLCKTWLRDNREITYRYYVVCGMTTIFMWFLTCNCTACRTSKVSITIRSQSSMQ